MRGLDAVRAWLDADLFQTDFRPVKLEEHVVLGEAVFCARGNPSAPGQSTGGALVTTPPPHAVDISKLPAFPHKVLGEFQDAGLHPVRAISLPESSTTRQTGRQAQIGDRVALHLAMEGMLVRVPLRECCKALAYLPFRKMN